MRKTSLTATERQIIETMLAEKCGPSSAFLRQLAVARVERRRLTGVGIFIDLVVPSSAPRVDKVNAELSVDYRTSMPAPDDLVGFLLFIRDGALSFLEGCTHGNAVWPEEPMEEWLILDPAKAPHEKAK